MHIRFMHHACCECVLSLPRRALVKEYVEGSISSMKNKNRYRTSKNGSAYKHKVYKCYLCTCTSGRPINCTSI